MIGQIGFAGVIVEDAQLYEFLVAGEFIGVFSSNFNKPIGKNLTYLNCVLRPIDHCDLPLELHFLRMIL